MFYLYLELKKLPSTTVPVSVKNIISNYCIIKNNALNLRCYQLTFQL